MPSKVTNQPVELSLAIGGFSNPPFAAVNQPNG